MIASGFGSLGMMTSVLVSPGGAFEYEAAHGTVRRHYYEHLKGNLRAPTRSRRSSPGRAPSASAASSTRLRQVVRFADELERAVLGLIEDGVVTKDLVGLVEPRPSGYESTESFIDKAALRLRDAALADRRSARCPRTASA
jgi:isocitrate dehydrogenase